MVLSDTAPPQSSFDDTPPQSDSDRYAEFSQSENLDTYRIDGTSLPKPFPGSSILGYNNANLAKLVHVRVDQARKILNRPPTTDEATALAYWTAKQVSILSYGTPVGVGLGLYRAYSTAPTFQFPFFKPDPEKFNPNVFPSPKYNLATGMKAITSWHAIRMLAYGTVGNFIGSILFASYSMSVVSIGEITDKRLKEYIVALKSVAQHAPATLKSLPQQPEIARAPGKPTGQETVDDASPTSGTFWELNDDNLADKGWISENDRRASRQPTSRPAIGAAPSGNPPAPRAPNGQFSDQTTAFDEASPTGGRGVADDMASTESAWERIRRQGSSQNEPTEESTWESRQPSSAAPTGQSARKNSSKWDDN